MEWEITMRKALLICYYFPPMGGAGVSRPLALFKHLHRYGYECHVLTVKPVAYRMFDPALLKGFDTHNIYRAGSRDPQRLMHLLGVRTVKPAAIRRVKSVSSRFFPDPKVGWVRSAVSLGRTLASNNRYDVIVSTSPPISCHLVAMKLAAECRLPWLADFRDFWTSYPAAESYDSKRFVRRALKLRERIRNRCDRMTAVNLSAADYLGADEVIPNGYDEDLAALWEAPDSMQFTIGLFGSFDANLVPIRPLLDVLAKLREGSPDLFNKIRLLQVGSVASDWLTVELEQFGMTALCEMHSFQPRQDAIRLLSTTSAFYFGLSSQSGSGIIPSRLFEILASGRPILSAVSPESEVEKLIQSTGNGYCFTETSTDGVVKYLSDLITDFGRGQLVITPCPDYSKPYTASRMVEKFAQLLDQL